MTSPRASATAIYCPFTGLPWLARLNLLGIAGLAAALTVLLWPHWKNNADLSHGFFMPVVFLFLLHEARAGTPRLLAASRWVDLFTSGGLLFGLLALGTAGLYAAAVDWSHSVVACTLTLSFVALLGSALAIFSSERVRFLPFNWSSTVAVGLWLLSAPIPPGTYTQLTVRLQLMITEHVLRALHLLGVAATRQGNVINLATTSVGVEEACSGVRSLLSCVFAGLLFSATLVRRPWARALLVALAAPLALVMNFVRSLTLTLLANSGVDISGTWHDLTGFAVLGVTALLLAGLALLLGKSPASPPAARPSQDETTATYSAPQRMLAAAFGLVVVMTIFFVTNTRPSIRQGLPVPPLAAILPVQVDGWRVETSRDLYQFSSTLHTEYLVQRTYLRPTSRGPEQITVYLAYWPAGQAPVSLVASHTPDACWPGSGWSPVAVESSRAALTLDGRVLPEAETRLFTNNQTTQHLWFWHLYDGRPLAYRDPYSARALLAIAWRYGFTHEGDQLFVRLSSNRPWTDLAREPLVAEIFSRLKTLGL